MVSDLSISDSGLMLALPTLFATTRTPISGDACM